MPKITTSGVSNAGDDAEQTEAAPEAKAKPAAEAKPTESAKPAKAADSRSRKR